MCYTENITEVFLMIKAYTATTREIDDPSAAAAEIMTALNPKQNMLKHSIGIITCFSEFDDTGALKAICDALPFECIGATSCVSAAGGSSLTGAAGRSEVDQIILAITVLTSDDCEFKTAAIPIEEDYAGMINEKMTDLLAQGKPALLLGFFPLIHTISGDIILSAIDKATGGIPLFGTMAVDHTLDYSTAKTIHNGEAGRQTVVICSIIGDIQYTFEVASLNEEKIRKQKALITKSEGNLLIGVNGKTALDYLEEIGLTRSDLATGIGVVPVIVDHLDGTKPVARGIFGLTPDGYAVCGGSMPMGATFAVGRVDMGDVLMTTEAALRRFDSQLSGNDGVMLGYSCMARYLVQGTNYTAEASKVTAYVRESGEMPYLFACSGGELCPYPDAEGKLRNFFHNYTAVFCLIK
jgi:hypothetical protein